MSLKAKGGLVTHPSGEEGEYDHEESNIQGEGKWATLIMANPLIDHGDNP